MILPPECDYVKDYQVKDHANQHQDHQNLSGPMLSCHQRAILFPRRKYQAGADKYDRE